MFWQIQRGGDDDHGEEEEDEGVCLGWLVRDCVALGRVVGEGGAGAILAPEVVGMKERFGVRGEGNVLKMNFSVGVSMYREKVTSYW